MNKPSFVVIDFETANDFRYSACQVSIITVVEGKIVDNFNTLINSNEKFGVIQQGIHGITEEMLEGQPVFADVYPKIRDKLSQGHLVLAHNAGFDMSVLEKTLKKYNCKPFNFNYGCSCQMIKKRFSNRFSCYKLKSVADELGFSFKHHDASEDTMVLVKIILELCKTQADFNSAFTCYNGQIKSFMDLYNKIR